MKVTVTRSWIFTIQPASAETCDALGHPDGTIEVLDEDGDRWSFNATTEEAIAGLKHAATNDNFWGGETTVEEVA